MATPLPTFSVSDQQLADLVAIFGNAAGYKAWLKAELWRKVNRHRRQSDRIAARGDLETQYPDLAPPEPVIE